MVCATERARGILYYTVIWNSWRRIIWRWWWIDCNASSTST